MFFTDVMGVSAGILGEVVLLLKVYDGVNDPLLGIFMDNAPFSCRGNIAVSILSTLGCVVAALVMFQPGGGSMPMGRKIALAAGSCLMFDIFTSLTSLCAHHCKHDHTF